MAETLTDSITFLGTGGARVMVSRQILASGGAWLELGSTRILLDPGPGSIVHAIRRKLDPGKLDAIILSHKHLDHSSDVNIMIEAMTHASSRKRGALFAPADALENDPVVFGYARGLPERIEVLREGGKYKVGEVVFETPVRHIHGVETYGLVFTTTRHVFSWVTDTRYFEGLARHYRGDLLVTNVVRLDDDSSPIQHLSIPDVKRLALEMKPRAVILTHFGRNVWAARPWDLAQRLTDETGIRVVAARDGMRFDLDSLDGAGPGTPQ